MLASTIARSASLQIKGLATKYTTVKWPIAVGPIHNVDSFYELVEQQMPFEVNDEMVQNLPFWMVNCTIWHQKQLIQVAFGFSQMHNLIASIISSVY